MLGKVSVMVEIRNGMPAVLLDGMRWRKSSHSGAVGNCVELACLPDGRVGSRNSRDPHGPVLVYSRAAFAGLIAGLERDE